MLNVPRRHQQEVLKCSRPRRLHQQRSWNAQRRDGCINRGLEMLNAATVASTEVLICSTPRRLHQQRSWNAQRHHDGIARSSWNPQRHHGDIARSSGTLNVTTTVSASAGKGVSPPGRFEIQGRVFEISAHQGRAPRSAMRDGRARCREETPPSRQTLTTDLNSGRTHPHTQTTDLNLRSIPTPVSSTSGLSSTSGQRQLLRRPQPFAHQPIPIDLIDSSRTEILRLRDEIRDGRIGL